MAPKVFDGYVSAAEFADQRGVTKRWLRMERSALKGPPFTKLGNAIYYPVEGIRDWLRARTVNTLAASTKPEADNGSINP